MERGRTDDQERSRARSSREKEYGPGGAVILGTTTLAVLMILCPFVLISLTTDTQGNDIPCEEPLLPCDSSVKSIVTIHSTHKFLSIHYKLYLNDALKAQGDLSPGSSIIKVVTIVFPTNQSGSYQAVILATSDGGGIMGNSDQAILTVQCGQTYPITLNI